MTLGEKITKLREENNLTQQDLAQKLNYTAQAISKWENNTSEPKLDTLREIAKIFNVSLAELLEEGKQETVAEENNKETIKNKYGVKFEIKEDEECINRIKALSISIVWAVFLGMTTALVMIDSSVSIALSVLCAIAVLILTLNFVYKKQVSASVKKSLWNFQCDVYTLANFAAKSSILFLIKFPLLLIDLVIYLCKLVYLIIKSLFLWGEGNV